MSYHQSSFDCLYWRANRGDSVCMGDSVCIATLFVWATATLFVWVTLFVLQLCLYCDSVCIVTNTELTRSSTRAGKV